MFHKRCTDRRAVRGGSWNREPWYCPTCIAIGPASATHHLPPPPDSQWSQAPRHPLLLEDESIIELVNPGAAMPESLDPSPPGLLPLAFSPSQAQATITVRYPSNSIRQRTSNVASLEPEAEFQKAAIDACRSTIVQQEAELKKLREGLDVRNKKIIQLEDQVGIAKTYLSSRDPEL